MERKSIGEEVGVTILYVLVRRFKSNNFCEDSQVKHLQTSKTLPSPKQSCNLPRPTGVCRAGKTFK